MSLILNQNDGIQATLNRQASCELVWIPENNYVPGTTIELRSKNLRTLVEWRYVRIEMEHADIKWRWKIKPDPTEIWNNKNRAILRAKLQYGVRKGEKCRILLTLIPPVWTGVDENFSVWVREPASYFGQQDEESIPFTKEDHSSCHIPVFPGDVERLSVYCWPMPGTDGKVRTCIVPEDRFGNPSEFKKSVKLKVEWEGRNWDMDIKKPDILYLDAPESTGRLKVYIPVACLAVTENIINGSMIQDDLVVEGNPVWGRREGPVAVFGEFHWHTDISGDGDGDIGDAFMRARDYLNMNFAAPSDHGPDELNWNKTIPVVEKYNKPHEFSTFFGWENSSDQGHENYYFTDPNHPAVYNGKAGIIGGRPNTFHEKLSKLHDFFAVPHHTNAVAETRNPQDDTPLWYQYSFVKPQKYMPLFEIMQLRGNQERNQYTDAWRGWHQNNGASAQDALAMGYRIGFTGGTDNHCSWPARAYAIHEGGSYHHPKSVIMTGVWTQSIERQSIFDALKNRSTWVVWDTRAIVLFKINDAMMGGEITLKKGELIFANIKASAEDAFQCVQIISDGRIVWESSINRRDFDIKVQISAAEQSNYYYVRGLLRNGGIFYASPVFVDVAEEKVK